VTTTLYAGWTPVWTVAFNTQQGSTVSPIAGVIDGSLITKPVEDPERAGYSFGGWHKEAAGTNAWDFDTDTVTANTTLYAKWIRLHTVTFNSGGGSDVAGLEAVLDGAVIAEPTAPVLANCAFEGWHKEAAYANKWDFNADTVAAETVLYARWTVTVAFNANGGSAAPASQILTRGGLAEEPETEPVNAGKTFMGWHREAAGTTAWNFATDRASVNTTLYAKREFVPVTGIVNVPVDSILRAPDLGVLDLGAAAMDPPKASVKTIGWTLKSAGGAGGGASFGDDTSVRLYANGALESLPTNGTVTIAKGAEYYISIDAGYSNIVWRLNGRVSSVTDRTIYLDTEAAGTLGVAVEAVKSGVTDGGAYTFIIK
jgi:uncharacterized repeat protein (TIGR02543 family)